MSIAPNQSAMPVRVKSPARATVPVTVIIPALNEERTLATIAGRVIATGLASQVLIVDDGSTDGTRAVALGLARAHPGLIEVLVHDRSRGKGAAIRTALGRVEGELILVQDADLEYDPVEYPALLAPFADPGIHAVYGSRNLRRNARSTWTYYWGGRALSAVTNLLYRAQITDEATGYKVVRTPVLRGLDLGTSGFEFCAELTGRLLRRGFTIREVPISYQPRSFDQGKKIRWRDGAIAVWVLVRERFSRASHAQRTCP